MLKKLNFTASKDVYYFCLFLSIFTSIINLYFIIYARDVFFNPMPFQQLLEAINPFKLQKLKGFFWHSLELNLIILFLFGLIQFKKNNSEFRILKFVLGICFLNLIASILIKFQVFFDVGFYFSGYFIYYYLGIIINLILCFTIYKCIIYLNKQIQNIKTSENVTSENVKPWKRLFHYIVDILLSVSIFSSIPALFLAHYEERKLTDTFKINFCVYISILLYFLFFENIFKTSPAKLLTETKVISNENIKPTFEQFFFRTLYRIIPLEAASIFLGSFWHDKLSKTKVVYEVEAKKPTIQFLWLFLGFVLSFLFIYLIHLIAYEFFNFYI